MTIGIVNLNFNVERIYRIPAFMPGGVYRPEQAFVQAGGKGVNAARVLKMIGEKAELTGCIGGPTGDWIRRDLEGMALRPFLMSGESRVCFCINDPVRGTDTVINENGKPLGRRETTRLKKHIERFACGKKMLLLLGSVVPGVTPADYAGIIRSVQKMGVPVVVDITGKHLKAALSVAPFALKPNLREWQEALATKADSVKALLPGVRKYLVRGTQWIILSRGRNGALFFTREGVWEAAVPQLKAVNTVGCGDALSAGFCKGIKEGWGPENVVRYASAVSAAHALTPLPGMVRRQDIEKLLRSIRIRNYRG